PTALSTLSLHDALPISARGVVIVDCTQCLEGTVNLNEYAAGSALARAGVISGYDMTAEAALAKLYYLFSRGFAPAKVRREMGRRSEEHTSELQSLAYLV